MGLLKMSLPRNGRTVWLLATYDDQLEARADAERLNAELAGRGYDFGVEFAEDPSLGGKQFRYALLLDDSRHIEGVRVAIELGLPVLD